MVNILEYFQIAELQQILKIGFDNLVDLPLSTINKIIKYKLYTLKIEAIEHYIKINIKH